MEEQINSMTLGVEDVERSFRFFKDNLGFPTEIKIENEIIFQPSGTCLTLYPLKELAEDISPRLSAARSGLPGITLSNNTRIKEEVDQIFHLVEKVDGVIVKLAQDVFWGGYSGDFTDPDGYYWEVAWEEPR